MYQQIIIGIIMSKIPFHVIAKKVLKTTYNGLLELNKCINDNFDNVCNLMLNCKGKIAVMGIGKSGHIANKIASTLSSTGTPAFFVHPTEASHGDLGMITNDDVVLALSNSGESHEILTIIPVLKRQNIPLICITGCNINNMSKAADLHIFIKIPKEDGLLGLIPTTISTAMLVMGDAIAISLLKARNFNINNFAVFHPGGIIGRKLLLRVSDLMYTGSDIPVVDKDANLSDVLIEITSKKLGMVVICDHNKQIEGIFTDGDLRRTFAINNVNLKDIKIVDLMITNIIKVTSNMLATDALILMNQQHITSLVVAKSNILIGVLHLHKLLEAGIV
uniref:Arabinose 5-phosphate isomerase n=1 Tax=Candidatus Aschnera chinzeii TaxID=1485666 RepID=A0AAT9G4G5_9ENTR|nr:MAG: arabinose-5-phosphate isomerase KdsD [Candidatus Aschnera chinzeii]